jgi:O-methyltransferase involved in polyketide biosynthesis
VGAGFDTSFFVFAKEGLLRACNTVFYEVDYLGVVQRKSQMISKTPELLEHVIDNTVSYMTIL